MNENLEERRWRTVLRVIGTGPDKEDGLIALVVPGWNPDEIVYLAGDDVPRAVVGAALKATPEIPIRFFGQVRLRARDASELEIGNWEPTSGMPATPNPRAAVVTVVEMPDARLLMSRVVSDSTALQVAISDALLLCADLDLDPEHLDVFSVAEVHERITSTLRAAEQCRQLMQQAAGQRPIQHEDDMKRFIELDDREIRQAIAQYIGANVSGHLAKDLKVLCDANTVSDTTGKLACPEGSLSATATLERAPSGSGDNGF